jgi:hypothetical protein
MKLRRASTLALVALPTLAMLLYACGGDDTTQPPGTDAGQDVTVDVKTDAKTDATSDAKTDAPSDGGTLNPTSQQIQDVRDAAAPVVVADGGSDAASDATVSDAATEAGDAATEGGADGGGGIPVNNLPIDKAIVTYVKGAFGTDPAGFFIQAEKTGPAIFVAVDPSTLNPVPVAGDEVSFKVTAVANVSSLRQIVALSGWTRSAQGKDLTALLQDLSAATNVITALDGYESEYIKLTATAAAAFGTAGTGFVSSQITTTGIGAPSTNFRVRLPATVQDSLDLSLNCSFTLTGAMWRFTTQAQPSGWVDGDVSAITCPAPTVVGATATALDKVVVTFDRKIDVNSLQTNGSQFTVNNGLTVSAAALSGPRQITLTTSAQTPAQAYTVTVTNTLKDLAGKAIANPNTANFNGYVVPAVVRLNELGPAIANGIDLIELRVVTAGNLSGITIEEYLNNGKTTLTTLPLLQVAVDDLVVVHFTPPNGVTDETVSKTGCADAACYPGAWDVKATTTNDLTNNGRVVLVRSPANGAIQDGIAYYRSNLTPSASYYVDVNALSAANQWVGCNGNACANNAAALPFSVNFNGVGTTATGNTVRRVSNTDTNAAADWAVGAHSWGLANP